jgi:hypothetical protein
MSVATVVDVIRQERSAGQNDDQIAALLRVSRVAPPDAHHHWTRLAVRAVMGEDEAGFTPDGRPGTGVR